MATVEGRQLTNMNGSGMNGPLVNQVPSLDIEDPKRDQVDHTQLGCLDRFSAMVFPIEDIFETFVFKYLCCCWIIPGFIKSYVPPTTRKIQGWTHLGLIVGICAAGFLVGQSLLKAICVIGGCYGSANAIKTRVKDILLLVYLTPCLVYFVRCINQFDERVREKQERIEQQKKELVGAFNETISDLDGLLTQSTESSSGLAERNFQSKKRDFERFLKQMKAQAGQMKVGSPQEMEQLTNQFKKMIINWLKVFQECSANPAATPLLVIKEGELDQMKNILEVVDLVLDRLKVNDVRFISARRDHDKKMIEGDKKEVRSFTGEDKDKAWYRKTIVTRMQAVAKQRVRMPAWIQIGRAGTGTSAAIEPLEDGYPWQLGCSCCALILLSREHVGLILGMFVGWIALALDIWVIEGTPNPITLAWTILVELCIFLLLARFEEVDQIQTLEREVRQLKARTEKVQKESEEIKKFWEEVQQIADIWLYRTVPRLDLHKEIHVLLEDTTDGKKLLDQLTNANLGLEYVETNIGEVGLWHGKGQLTKDAKQGLGTAINKMCRELEDGYGMDHITNIDLKRIQGERKSLKPLQNA